MHRLLIAAATLAVVVVATTDAQTQSPDALAASLKQGGYVIVMRHASSPREAPDAKTANKDNTKLERQLDDTGRTTAAAMGKALRDLKIPIGDVLTSPTYRALETVRLAQLPSLKAQEELGDGGQSMQAVAEAQATWLRERIKQMPKGTNTLLITHMPNIARAFPDWGAVADGEAVVVGPDGKGGVGPLGRIKIEEWPRLK
jgi:phosphohistidine phosphatase SixA